MTYHWHGGLPGLVVVLTFLSYFLDSHGVMGFASYYFLLVLWFLIIVGSITSSYSSWLEQILCSPRPTWVELLVPRVVGWNKCFAALEKLGLSY